MPRYFSRMMFRNRSALRSYSQAQLPSTDVITRDTSVVERRVEYRRPDHYLDNQRAKVLRIPCGSSDFTRLPLAGVLLSVLDDVADHFLFVRGNEIRVQESRFGEWQDTLPKVSPLLVACRMIQKTAPPPITGNWDAYARDWLDPNFSRTALAYPLNPIIDDLIRRHGLADIHCHLSGVTEADSVWLDAVANPDAFYRVLWKAWDRDARVKELYQQIENDLHPYDIWRILSKARDLRWSMSEYVFGASRTTFSAALVRDELSDRYSPQWSTPQHPADQFLGRDARVHPLVTEAAFLIATLARLQSDESDALAHAFYFCALVQAEIVELSTQQTEQFGFEQFHKITNNGARDMSERVYGPRFRQMNVTSGGDLQRVEGRFAPKETPGAIRELADSIEKGYRWFQDSDPHARRTDLVLVAHFIKKPDQSPAGYRHFILRRSLDRQARALIAAFSPPYGFEKPNRLAGVDAASNEMSAPPEVFAPIYRMLRRRGVLNATFHVGEDFVHLLSGIRAVHEAANFLELGAGCRIGHATAIGLDPEMWARRVGPRIVVAQGDYLDDLVFAHHRLSHTGGFSDTLARVAERISELSRLVYSNVSHPPGLLLQAWRLRLIDPGLAFDPARIEDMLDERARSEEKRLTDKLQEDSGATELYYDYHGQGMGRKSLADVYKEWYAPIEVDVDLIPPEALRMMQDVQLEELARSNIAVESMLTSNLRIGHYYEYREHHIFRWLGLTAHEMRALPAVCIGSDDPGIFATNMRSEYCHLYRELTTTFGKSPAEASAMLEQLIRNAQTFRFFPPGAGSPSAP